jgi:type II secretory pathway pseudopilin PulG
MKKNKEKRKAAISLIEVMIASVIFMIFALPIFLLSLQSLDRTYINEANESSLSYAQEALEAAKSIANRNYLNLANGTYGLDDTSGQWEFSGTSDTQETLYLRTVTIEDVYRDGSGDIAATGTLDPHTKKISVNVAWTWRQLVNYDEDLVTYMSNWTTTKWTESTCTEFNAGTLTDMDLISTASPPGDNCSLSVTGSVSFSSFYSRLNLGAHGNGIDVEDDYSFTATHKSNVGLQIHDISDRENPVSEASLDVGARGLSVLEDSDVLYMGVQSSTAGFTTIDVGTKSSPTQEDTINVGGYGNRGDLSGDYFHLGVEAASGGFVIIDVSSPSVLSIESTLDVGAVVNDVKVSGDYAYLATEDASSGFIVVDISDPAAPSEVASIDVDDEANAVFVNGAFAYVGTKNATDSFKIINISSPTSPSLITSIDLGVEVMDITINGAYIYTVMDDNSENVGIIDNSNPLSAYLLLTDDIGGKATSTVTDSGYVYTGQSVANPGVTIVELVSAVYGASGEYISSEFDRGSESIRYNSLEWNESLVSGSTIDLMVRSANSSPNLSSATWVGSDGTDSSTYTDSIEEITLDPSRTGNRYFQYKVNLTSDGNVTPQVHDVTLDYSL